MSQTKKYKFQIILILTLVCFFMFGCKNETPVQDIYFNLGTGEQIVLIVGQTLDVEEYVVVKPSYATNKKYDVVSFNEDVVKVENNKLIALKADNAVIKVTSKDNPMKESVMTVVVKASVEQLQAPLNLSYNSATQSFTFDPVLYASSYTLKINGEEIELGNSNVFNLSQYQGRKFDNLLIAQVRANAPGYSFALQTSSYSSEYKIYQAGEVSNLRVVGGTATFDKSANGNIHDIYLGEEKISEGLSGNYLYLNNLEEKFAGVSSFVGVETVVSDEIKQQYGNSVEYFNSAKKLTPIQILDVPNLSLSATSIGWQNIAHAAGYLILLDGNKIAETTQNNFDLKSLENYDELVSVNMVHELKVNPVLASDSVGIGKTVKGNLLKVKRIENPTVICDGYDLKWESVNNASVYAIKLNGVDVDFESSTSKNSFSMRSYPAGVFQFGISSVATVEPDEDGVYYLSSIETIKEFEKLPTLQANIEDYVLNITGVGANSAKIDFDIDDYDTIVSGENIASGLDLSDYLFDAGNHSIVLTCLGDANKINSDSVSIEFVQLERIENITVTNGVASVLRSEINEHARIVLEISGEELDSPIYVDNTGYQFNTTDVEGENYLPEGIYSTKVYVYGDGASTFSYRESGNVVAHAGVDFEVLKAPSSEVLDTAVACLTIENIDKAEGFNIFEIKNDQNVFVKKISTNEFNFVLNNGTVEYAMQSVGNGSTTLNSVVSSGVAITRLITPTLFYDNTTDIITKEDLNIEGLSGYVFTHNGEVEDYDFSSAFVLDEIENVFTLTAMAISGNNDGYYLNSAPFILELEKISNVAEMSISGLDNNLMISTTHNQEFDLEVEITLTSGIQTFKTRFDEGLNKKVLSNGLEGEDEIILQYSYSRAKYQIKLIDSNYNAIIEETNNSFYVRVRFIKPSTGNDILINSEFSDSATLDLVRIDAETEISINAENQMVIAPVAHSQEFALVVVINNGTDLIFASNGEGELVCEDVELEYEFRGGKYYVSLLDENYASIIEFGSNFSVKVKYSFMHNGTETDVDSGYCEIKNISVQPSSSISRVGQNLKITNVKNTYTYSNYSLIINNYILPLNNAVTMADGYIEFDVEFIYNNVPSNKIGEINKVEVLTNNSDTTNEIPILSKKSECIYISKTQTLTLANYKYNDNEDGQNNNSTIIYFSSYETEYDKSYLIELFNGGNKICTLTSKDVDAVADVISYKLDEIADLYDIVGTIEIVGSVKTSGTKVVDGKNVEVFNSVLSNQLRIEKIDAPINFNVSDNIMTFDAVSNAVGYEVWEITGTGKVKLNNQLLTTNSFDVSHLEGQKQLVVKAISRTGNFSNSAFGAVVQIYKLAQPNVSFENGKIKVALTLDLIQLFNNPNITIIPEISNSSTDKIEIDVNEIGGRDIYQSGLNIFVEPYVFLSYNSQSLTGETCSVRYKVNQTGDIGGIYYLNSNIVEVDCYGLFEPLEVKKTTSDNNSVEMISWNANPKNSLAGNSLSVGYIFKIEYMQGEDLMVYYSDDANLKYYDKSSGEYVSYPTYISSTSMIFPAGYGLDDEGNIQVAFGAGTYKVSLQSVPLSTIEGYNLCSSTFSSACEFEIMATPILSVVEGKVVWEENPKAAYYTVSIFQEGDSTPFFRDTSTVGEYDFSNSNLNALTGVYNVVVKSISDRDDTLNSANSEDYYIYRLPQAKQVYIEDGYLILDATYFLSGAIIEFIDTANGMKYVRYLDNTNVANYIVEYMQTEYAISNWENFTYSFAFSLTRKYELSLESLKILDGRDYQIDVKLLGNTHQSLGMIDSSEVVEISKLTATKLKPNVVDVNLGVVQFMPDEDYATVSKDGIYTPLVNINYVFNASSASAFWRDTVMYKAVVTTNLSVVPIYAVDYYSFKTAVENGTISANDYELLSGSYGLYACAKYSYLDGGVTKTLRFNVYEDNMINLRDYDALYYYSITETMEDGKNKYECANDYSMINLAEGGSFAIEVFMLGGDSYASGQKTLGYLTSQANVIRTFTRYGVNQLAAHAGKVQFNNALQFEGEEVVDYPVYKLVITSLNSHVGQVVYLYHTTEEYARDVAKRHDPSGFENALYIQAQINEENNKILFDMSQYFSAGAYRISVRTLAGFGTGATDEQDYLLNAQEPTIEYNFQKLSDTNFVSTNGVLEFAQSYIVRDGNKIYFTSYEISLKDHSANKVYVYNIDETTDGVTVDSVAHVVRYVIPKNLILQTENGTISVITDGGKTYSIKVKANSTDNYILNGTYKTSGENEIEFIFEKSLGLSETAKDKLRIENGILKWKVLDLDNFVKTIIKVSFLDENLQTKTISIAADDFNKYEKDGVYQYHYYQFADGKYNLDTAGSAYILDKMTRNYGGTYAEEVVEYTITAYTIGKTIVERNIINSNPCSSIVTTRLGMVDASTIKSVDGILLWNAVDNASSYEIVLSNGIKNFNFNTTKTNLNFLDEDNMLDVGAYKVQIRAIGSGKISSMMSSADDASGFVQLDVVDFTSIEIVDNAIVWNAVENADAYKVVFEYNDLSGTKQTIVNDEIFEPIFTTPSGISGIFKITISAISKGPGKEFNSQSVEFTSSSDAPMQVENFEFDNVSNLLIIDVKKVDFLTGDKLLIAYNFAEYSPDGVKPALFKTITISYLESGRFIELDEETMRYYYPVTTMGQYTNISVQVTRAGTVPSNAVMIADIDFNLYSYGDGSQDNPYRISNAEQLLNIEYFSSANFVLISSINMDEINVQERLNDFGAIISEEFSGVLDGATFSIFGFNLDEAAKTDILELRHVENFALFKTINNATIKNLSIGTENIQLILINTFANNVENVVNLSLIATGANNSIIENVNIVNFKLRLKAENQAKLSGEVYVAGLISNATNTTISNSSVDFSVEISMNYNGSVYVGGLMSKAETSNVTDSEIVFNLTSATNDTLYYAGGVVGYYLGNNSRLTGITNTHVELNISNAKVIYFGGLVGFAKQIRIEGSSTSGSYSRANINYTTYIGGLVGLTQSSLIKNSGSSVEFNISVSSTQNKYVGAIAGSLTISGNVSCVVENCYMTANYQEETTITTTSITLGIYGSRDPNVKITGCYKLEK